MWRSWCQEVVCGGVCLGGRRVSWLAMLCSTKNFGIWKILIVSSIEFHDALGYSWLCTQAKEVNFEMPVSPRDDGDVGLYYEMNYQVFTTCSTDKHKNRNPKDNCKTYMNNRPQDAHTHKRSLFLQHLEVSRSLIKPFFRTVLNHKLTFDHWNGISIYQLQYKYPSAFKGLGVWYGDIDMILDSPCGWTPEDEDNMEVHWQWLGRPRDCTQLSCEGSRYINFWRKAPYERIYN